MNVRDISSQVNEDWHELEADAVRVKGSGDPMATIHVSARPAPRADYSVRIQGHTVGGHVLRSERHFVCHRDDIPALIVMLRAVLHGPLGRLAILAEENERASEQTPVA